jgi:bifunctional non-homologous end joining protein LigD
MARPKAKAEPALGRYNEKRDFTRTSEPSGKAATGKTARRTGKDVGLSYVIQKHWASRLHYDFRLELDDVLLSWALPKGPSFDPADKRTAIHVEDHPVSYGGFEGTIPAKQYGAGTVIVWDRGTWEPVGDPREGMAQGKLLFHLHGEKLAGLWELVRISRPADRKQDHWILFKKKGDAWVRPRADYDVVTALPDSVVATPLGLVEEREPRAPATTVRATAMTEEAPDLSQAIRSALPEKLEPQLATLASNAPTGPGWLVDPKYDGYRIMARIAGGKARLLTRGGHDWTGRMPALARAVEALGIKSGWIDGEIVVMDDAGVPDFNALQNAFDTSRSEAIEYFVFDAPFLNGKDLRRVPLWSRRAALKAALEGKDDRKVRFSQDFDIPPLQMLDAACRMGLEGIMAKRRDSAYTSGRSENWLKLKCSLRQEFVIVGFTDRSGSKAEVGGLLFGYHEDGELRYAGSVGTGWSSATGQDLHRKLSAIESDQPAVDPATVKPGRWSRRAAGTERWVKPQLVAEVGFSEWTPDGHIRHPTFKGLRTDKLAKVITREQAAATPAGKPAAAKIKPVTSVKVTNPERVIDPSTGLTKVDLVRYYESVSRWILPHLNGRPVSLVRAPGGITGQLFFQKHLESKMPGLTELDPALWPGHTGLLAIDSAEALVAAAQLNVVELHTWNSTTRAIDNPDRVIFDLDPGEGVSWAHVQEAAILTRTMLSELGLESWVKTSGGKGLHVVVPLAPKLDYEIVKGFSQAVVQHMAKAIPQRFVAKSGPANRLGKIFIDYLRNGHAQTTAAAFSARARPGMGVSMPVAWDDVPGLKSGSQWTIVTAREHLSFQQVDPWTEYVRSRQTLTAPMKRLGYRFG